MPSAQSSGQADAISMLMDDHQAVDHLFRRFESSREGGSPAEQRLLIEQMTQELTLHAEIEEEVFYPAVRRLLAQGDQLVEECLHEHAEVKGLLTDISSSDPESTGYDPKVMTLIGDVRHHVNEEESEILPKLRQAIGTSQLVELGRRLAEAKQDRLVGSPATVRTMEPARAIRRDRRAPSGRKVYDVIPEEGGGWKVKAKGASRASSRHRGKQEAVRRAKDLAKRSTQGQVVVHRADGTIQNEFNYGDDPRRRGG
jgi:hemerythrin superfamily protein